MVIRRYVYNVNPLLYNGHQEMVSTQHTHTYTTHTHTLLFHPRTIGIPTHTLTHTHCTLTQTHTHTPGPAISIVMMLFHSCPRTPVVERDGISTHSSTHHFSHITLLCTQCFYTSTTIPVAGSILLLSCTVWSCVLIVLYMCSWCDRPVQMRAVRLWSSWGPVWCASREQNSGH